MTRRPWRERATDRVADTLARLVETRAGSILLLLALLACLAGAFAARIEIDPSAEGVYLAGDPEIDRARALAREFSSDEVIIGVWELPSAFTAADLRNLASLGAELAALKGVEEAISLANVEDIRPDSGALDVSPLVDLERIDEEIEAVRRRARGHRLYQGLLVGSDLDVLTVLVIPEADLHTRTVTHELVPQVSSRLDRFPGRGRVHVVGYPVGVTMSDALVQSDLMRLGPFLLLVILVGTAIAFRSAILPGLVLIMVVWCELVTLAWFGATGVPIRMITSIVPIVLIALSTTYVIYYANILALRHDSPQPVAAAVRDMFRPALLSALSTIVGFLSLRLVPLQAIGELGTSLAIAIAASFAGVLLLLPALCRRFDLRLQPVGAGALTAVGQLGVRLARHPGAVFAVAILLVAVVVPGIARIRIDSDPIAFFPRDHPFRVGTEFVREKLAGDRVTRVRIETGESGGALEPSVLRFAKRMESRAKESPIVADTASLLDYLWLMDAALNPERPPRAVPETRALAAQYMLLYESGGDPEDFRHYVNHDRSALSLVIRIGETSAQGILGLRDELLSFAEAEGQPGVEVVGLPHLESRAFVRLTRGMVEGLLTAAVLILAVVWFALGSMRLALMAMIPNLLPVAMCGGVVGFLGIPLSAGTSIVACVALGLAVDDTSHVLGHLGVRGGLREIYRRVSRPIGLTSLCLGAGFAVLGLSEFESVRHLGLAIAGTLGVAWAADVLLLPSLLVLAGRGRLASDDDLANAVGDGLQRPSR